MTYNVCKDFVQSDSLVGDEFEVGTAFKIEEPIHATPAAITREIELDIPAEVIHCGQHSHHMDLTVTASPQ